MTAGADKREYMLGNLSIYEYRRYNQRETGIKVITGK